MLFMSFILLFAVFFIACQNKRDVEKYLEKIPQADWQRGTIELTFKQPVDHKHPTGPKFSQRVVLSHVGYDRPVVVMLEGYDLHSTKRAELADLLNANQIRIEHRYFAQSTPDSVNWEHLTIWQAATDHHKIINALKGLYREKWVTTGISKGGRATMYHRRFYPDDVDASVAYVAPLVLPDKKDQLYNFMQQLGSSETRQKIRSYQKRMLSDKKTFLPLFEAYVMEKNYDLAIPLEQAYETMVLNYSFAFWQWGRIPPSNIPAQYTSDEDCFNHLVSVASPSDFDKEEAARMKPFYYQRYTETGPFKGQITGHLKEYLTDTTMDVVFDDIDEMPVDSTAMIDINSWLKKHGDQMMYLYGENDPWTAAAFKPSKKTDACIFINPGGSHSTRIESFPLTIQDSIYTVLEKWLDVDIETE